MSIVALDFVTTNIKKIVSKFEKFTCSGSSDHQVETVASYVAKKGHEIKNSDAPDYSTFDIVQAIFESSEISKAMGVAGGLWEAVHQLPYFEDIEQFNVYLAKILLDDKIRTTCCSCF